MLSLLELVEDKFIFSKSLWMSRRTRGSYEETEEAAELAPPLLLTDSAYPEDEDEDTDDGAGGARRMVEERGMACGSTTPLLVAGGAGIAWPLRGIGRV